MLLFSKGGVLENEGGTEGDTAWEDAMEKGRGVDLFGLGKGAGKGGEFEKVWLGIIGIGRGREGRKMGSFGQCC